MWHGDHEQTAGSGVVPSDVNRVPVEAQKAFVGGLAHTVLDFWHVGVDTDIGVQERCLEEIETEYDRRI